MRLVSANRTYDYILYAYEILNTLKAAGLYVDDFIIAGGAVRDILHNRPISDVDIYIRKPLNFDVSKIANINIIGEDLTLVSVPSCVQNSKYTIGYVNTYKSKKLNMKYQFIHIPGVKDLSDIVRNTFDIGLCKCWLDSSMTLHQTKSYTHDSENKVLTVYPDNLDGRQIISCFGYHLPKLKKKYPWPVMVTYNE